jgi:hypothetical protein
LQLPKLIFLFAYRRKFQLKKRNLSCSLWKASTRRLILSVRNPKLHFTHVCCSPSHIIPLGQSHRPVAVQYQGQDEDSLPTICTSRRVIENNINRANAILERAELKDLDWLVLPEMVFSGELSTMDKYHLSNQTTLLFCSLAILRT